MINYGTDYDDPMAEDGALLLDALLEWLLKYVAFPSYHAAVTVALWCAHTHLVAVFESTPRLALLSPEKQCGKTRVLECIELVTVGAERLIGASPAYMFRRIEGGSITALIDEADTVFKEGKADESAEALRQIVNAGHRPGAFVGRSNQKGEVIKYRVYAPVALAGIGDLPETIMDRSVIIRMRRRAPDESVNEFRFRTAAPEGRDLKKRLEQWARAVESKVGEPWPQMPEGVTDRPADVWEPLLMVADLAGGDWPKSAREACAAFVTGSKDDQSSVGVQLLKDLRDIFGGAPSMSTQLIITKLAELDNGPWAEWNNGFEKRITPTQLAKLLKPYGITPKVIRVPGGTPRGYHRESFIDAWNRYLPPPHSRNTAT